MSAPEPFSLLGEDARFWLAVGVGTALKWLFTPKTEKEVTRKEVIGGIVAGAAAAYYLDDWIIRTFSSIDGDQRDLVVIALVLTGEHIVRGLISAAPEMIASLLKSVTPQKKDQDNG